MTSRIMQAVSTAWVANPHGGQPRLITRGELFQDDDPIVRSNPSFFRSVDELVEQTTAAPGEKRAARPRP